MSDRPNILFLMTDQHRGDCIGADPASPTDSDGRPIVHTPNLNSLVGEGTLFARAYTPAPSCAPARRSLWTGMTPAATGATGWVTTDWDDEHYLPQLLADAGYRTAHVGKLHVFPPGKDIGFEHHIDAMHATGGEVVRGGPSHEYDRWLWEESDGQYVDLSHGLDSNSWDARPTHLPEHETDTFWRTSRALETLADLEGDRPFFLTISHWNPHQPFDPPEVYYDMYRDRRLPSPALGDWVDEVFGNRLPEYPKLNAYLADLPPRIVERARACYYGLVTQIDQQFNRLMRLLRSMGELENTYVVMTSDHGEMLGDHHLWRKCFPYEGSARIPLLLRVPPGAPYDRGQVIDRPVGLEDVMPTLLDVAGVDVPAAVDGQSLLTLVADPATPDWRTAYHGEHASLFHRENATQYLVTERFKFVWNPVTGDEHLFDLQEDSRETTDLTGDGAHADTVERFRIRLVEQLGDREEEFTRDGSLYATDRPYNWPMAGEEDQYVGELSGSH